MQIQRVINILVLSSLAFTAQAQPETRELHQPIVEADRVVRPSVQRNHYILNEEQVTGGTLSIRMREQLDNGTENVSNVASYPLNVSPQEACAAPAIEVLHPAAGTPIYNPRSSELPLPTASAEIQLDGVLDESDFDPDWFGIDVYELTVTAPGDITLNALLDPTEWKSFEVHIYTNDGSLSEDDFIERIEFYDERPMLTRAFEAGDYYLLVMGAFPDVDLDNLAFRRCYEICYDDPYPYQVTLTTNSPILQMEQAADLLGVDFFRFKISPPAYLDNVFVSLDGQDYSLRTNDGYVFYLQDPDFYQSLFVTAPSSVDITATTECSQNTTQAVPLNIQDDTAPDISFIEAADLSLYLGAQEHLTAQVLDPSRNVQEIVALAFPVDFEVPSDVYTLDDFMALNPTVLGRYQMNPQTAIDSWATPTVNQISASSFSVQVPVSTSLARVTVGDYDLRLLAVDTVGQASISPVRRLNIEAPAVAPLLSLLLPNYRIPAGGNFAALIDIRSLGPLASLELVANGAGYTNQIFDVDVSGQVTNDYEVQLTLQQLLTVADGAAIGDTMTITVTLTDLGGQQVIQASQIEVGEWGERSVVVSTSGFTDNTMRYANLEIQSGVRLTHRDHGILFNSITIRDGGTMVVARDDAVIDTPYSELIVRELLQIDAGAIVEVAFDNQGVSAGGSGSHGGDSRAGFAHGDFRNPQFPGKAGFRPGGVPRLGGGAVIVTVPRMIHNGDFTANAETPTSFDCSALVNGAGGTIRIEVENISGTGLFQANGASSVCNNNYTGAGGRIGIFYEQYGSGTENISDNFEFQVLTGAGIYFTRGGYGTVFLKRPDQEYGDLLVPSEPSGQVVDIGGGFRPTTPIGGLGRRSVNSVESLGENLYRVSHSGGAWPVANNSQWLSGLAGNLVSLEADNPDAPLYTVVGNNATSITFESLTPVDSEIVGNDLIGVVRLNSLSAGFRARVTSQDRVYADSYQIAAIENVANIADLRVDSVHNLGDYVHTQGRRIFLGTVNADSLTVSGGEVLIYNPSLVLTGNIDLAVGGVLEIYGDLTAANVTLSNDARLVVTGNLNIGNLVLNDGASFTSNGILVADSITLEDSSSFNSVADVQVNGDVVIAATANFASNLTVDGRLTITPDINSRPLVSGNLIVNGISMIENIDVRGTTNFNSDVTFRNGLLGGNVAIAGNLLIDGVSTIPTGSYNGRVTFSSELSVGGTSTLVNHVLLTSYDAATFTGDVVATGLGGTSGLSSLWTIGGQELISFGGNLTLTGAQIQNTSRPINIAGDLTVTDSPSYISFTGASTVGGTTRLVNNGIVANQPTASTTFDGNFVSDAGYVEIYQGDLIVQGDFVDNGGRVQAYPGGRIQIEGNFLATSSFMTLAGGLIVNGPESVSDRSRITISGSSISQFNGNLSVTGGGSGSAPNLQVSIGDLAVTGTVRASNQAYILASIGAMSTGSGEFLEGSRVDADQLEVVNGNLLLDGGSQLLIDEAIVVTDGLFAAAGGANINAPAIIAQSINFDGTVAPISVQTTSIIAAHPTPSSGVIALLATNVNPLRESATGLDLPELEILVEGGTFLLDGDSTLNFSGITKRNRHADYLPLCASGELPRFSYGGLGGTGDCTYGRYDSVLLPGIGNTQNGSVRIGGGGLVTIRANTVSITGEINVNANSLSASGGGINVIASQVIGTGNLFANGYVGTSNPPGGGGRIFIGTDDPTTVTLNMQANGGFRASSSTVDGAGTIFITDSNLNTPRLILNNNGNIAPDFTTPLRSVGRLLIADAQEVSDDVWEITANTANWIRSDAANEVGLAGMFVSLDAANLSAPLYRITSNTENTLTIETTDDLSGVVSNDLIGVHEFETLTVTGGAYADFGDDRVIVNDILNSVIDLARVRAAPDSVLE